MLLALASLAHSLTLHVTAAYEQERLQGGERTAQVREIIAGVNQTCDSPVAQGQRLRVAHRDSCSRDADHA